MKTEYLRYNCHIHFLLLVNCVFGKELAKWYVRCYYGPNIQRKNQKYFERLGKVKIVLAVLLI